jgi:N-succinyldiaminopimelate aminotransferase
MLRESVARWLERRYSLQGVDAETQVLSANGTREALFSVAHALINPELEPKPYVLMPNPMYQIYYGASVTAGAVPFLLSCEARDGFEPKLDRVPDHVWRNTSLVYVCSPSNPTGWVAAQSYYAELLGLADHYDFVVCADECYSEIYWETPPPGLLQVAQQLGRTGFERCLVFNSLSKRSALPGLRSGFIAGDGELIRQFSKLRSYTGPATPLPLQMVATRAWQDETHVQANRCNFRESLKAFYATFKRNADNCMPAGAFFVWLNVGNCEDFAVAAFEQQAVTVLPGCYLGVDDHAGHNPGRGFVRIALVDGPEKAAEVAARLNKVRIAS